MGFVYSEETAAGKVRLATGAKRSDRSECRPVVDVARRDRLAAAQTNRAFSGGSRSTASDEIGVIRA